MKPNIIRINDISDIETSKISVYDLNNRYIDRFGNMYGVKFNPASHRIEIIRIVRAVDREVAAMQQKIFKTRLTGAEQAIPDQEQAGGGEGAVSEEEYQSFEPELFVNDCLKLMTTHRSRIKGIIMNIKNSNVFPKENKQDSIELENVFRNLEIDGDQGFDNVENYQKELTGYPRSISYYQAKIDNRGNQTIEALGDDKERIMKFVYIYEMYTSISGLYKSILRIMTELKAKIAERGPDDIKGISHNDKQAYLDAGTSIDNTIMEIRDLLERMRSLEQYVSDPSNF